MKYIREYTFDLIKWMDQNNIFTWAQMEKICGISRSHLFKLGNDDHVASEEMANKILQSTSAYESAHYVCGAKIALKKMNIKHECNRHCVMQQLSVLPPDLIDFYNRTM